MIDHAVQLADLRVDFVGSFLRPEMLKTTFLAFAAGSVDAQTLRAAEDRAIRDLIAEQERYGLPLVNDGEFRRRQFMESFTDVAGMEPWHESIVAAEMRRLTSASAPEPLTQEHGNEMRRPVSEKIWLRRNVPLDEYRFAASVATKPVKVTLINPDRLSQRFAYEESRAFYESPQAFLDDVIAVQRTMISELAEAGCRYVHIDAPGYTAYVDEETTSKMRERGEDPAANLERSIAADNAVIADFPDVVFGVHLCRGNSRSQWHRRGGYDAIAERLFNSLRHHRFLLEYDDERSGGFEPLRFVPKGKTVVLGLITSKTPRRETVDDLKRRIDEASKFVPLEQLALSPQCGFASTLVGNALTEDDQWRKINVMMETARAVWGQWTHVP